VAAVVFYFLFDRIGWRGMFMVGMVPALLVVLLRFGVKESPVFEAEHAHAPKRSVAFLWGVGLVALAAAVGPSLAGMLDKTALWRWVYLVDAPIALCGLILFRKHWKMALYVVVLMTAFNVFSHGTQDLYPTFLQVQHKLGTQTVGMITAIMNVGAITGGLIFGAWSETLGRKRAIILAALMALPVIPLWAFSHSLALLTLGAFAMQVMVQGAWGVIPAHLNELSPSDSRGTFPGFAYQLGNLLASGNAVLQAGLAEARGDNYGWALAAVAGTAAVVIAVVTYLGPERRGLRFEGGA
jgi:SHS family lactate transporter-like MFS transporter